MFGVSFVQKKQVSDNSSTIFYKYWQTKYRASKDVMLFCNAWQTYISSLFEYAEIVFAYKILLVTQRFERKYTGNTVFLDRLFKIRVFSKTRIGYRG